MLIKSGGSASTATGSRLDGTRQKRKILREMQSSRMNYLFQLRPAAFNLRDRRRRRGRPLRLPAPTPHLPFTGVPGPWAVLTFTEPSVRCWPGDAARSRTRAAPAPAPAEANGPEAIFGDLDQARFSRPSDPSIHEDVCTFPAGFPIPVDQLRSTGQGSLDKTVDDSAVIISDGLNCLCYLLFDRSHWTVRVGVICSHRRLLVRFFCRPSEGCRPD